MNQNEIIEMTRQAGMKAATAPSGTVGDYLWGTPYQIEAFAKLVAAKEREACANLCDEREKDFMGLFHKYGHEEDSGAMLASMQCAKAIRERAQADGGEA